jgi:hypothetical protein
LILFLSFHRSPISWAVVRQNNGFSAFLEAIVLKQNLGLVTLNPKNHRFAILLETLGIIAPN